MTLKYHQSPKTGTWTRCVARGAQNGGGDCPFGAPAVDHLDRTQIAVRSGGVVATTQAGVEKRFVVTPVVGGVYAVVGPDGTARTYTAKGELIAAKDRATYFEKTLKAKLEEEQSAKAVDGGEASAQDRCAPVHSAPASDDNDAVHSSEEPSASAPVHSSPSGPATATSRQSAKARAALRRRSAGLMLRAVRTLAAGYGSANSSPARSHKARLAWSFLFGWFAELFTDPQL